MKKSEKNVTVLEAQNQDADKLQLEKRRNRGGTRGRVQGPKENPSRGAGVIPAKASTTIEKDAVEIAKERRKEGGTSDCWQSRSGP